MPKIRFSAEQSRVHRPSATNAPPHLNFIDSVRRFVAFPLNFIKNLAILSELGFYRGKHLPDFA